MPLAIGVHPPFSIPGKFWPISRGTQFTEFVFFFLKVREKVKNGETKLLQRLEEVTPSTRTSFSTHGGPDPPDSLWGSSPILDVATTRPEDRVIGPP